MNRSRPPVEACWLGSLPYRPAWELQQALVEEVRAGLRPATLLLLEHPHVFTMGRGAHQENLLWDEGERGRRGVEVVWVDRGGDVTYHGPGQLVGYPIVSLAEMESDVLRYVHGLESSLIAYLAGLGLAGQPGGRGLTGVWLNGEKLAAIGIMVRGGVTSHGFALNVGTDLGYFDGIVGCGLPGKRSTSVARLGMPQLSVREAALGYAPFFAEAFGLELIWTPASALTEALSSDPTATRTPTSGRLG